MPWFYVEDDFAFHRKTVAAGNSAVGLWARAGSWSMQILTDGEIPTAVARSLGTAKDAKRLTDVGLWIPKGTDYTFHQWSDRQRSRAQIEAEREAARIRQQRRRRDPTGQYAGDNHDQ